MEVKMETFKIKTEDKLEKTKDIILREFGQEIAERENDVIVIQEKIQLTQRYIKVLKYVSAYSYYQQDDSKNRDSGDSSTETAIHPCVQRLLPSRKELKKEQSSGGFSDFEVNFNANPTADEHNPRISAVDQSDVTVVRGAIRIKHTIVVGNVSKWIPPEYRDDQATHKWMLYVRDKKRDEGLGKLIQKVRYFLHESYKPHDIIDTTSAPFHLTRRGWGEFPVRVKIFFNHPDNKPVDFVHQLRLDKTSSGMQMLGGETQIDIDLYHDSNDSTIEESTIKEEPPKASALDNAISIEHDYCATSGKVSSNFDSRPILQPQQISFLSKIDNMFSELSLLENWNPSTNMTVAEWYFNNVVNQAQNVYFLSTEACVKWLLHRWPIVTKLAENHLYRSVHPYSFSTWQKYVTSNVGKRRASEWFRAVKIMNILKTLFNSTWSTKEIMMYARMHGYTLMLENQYFIPYGNTFKKISTFTNQVDKTRDLRQLEISRQNDEIDILGENHSQPELLYPLKKSEHCLAVSSVIRYVDETAKEIGIKLKEEEVMPNVFTNATSQMIAKLLKLFVEELLRKSLANAWLRNGLKNPGSIEIDDVLKSIVESPELDLFTNSGLGAKNTAL